jgi:hypothetical protein
MKLKCSLEPDTGGRTWVVEEVGEAVLGDPRREVRGAVAGWRRAIEDMMWEMYMGLRLYRTAHRHTSALRCRSTPRACTCGHARNLPLGCNRVEVRRIGTT